MPKSYINVLEKWSSASDELRSVNAQIEYLLTKAARKTGRWKEDKRQKNTKKHKMDTQTQDTLDD
ncbi:hypothetical protein [Nostoc sp.]|uniref:hypothetical protein n=1 Tax=Nostoc sp. TaxID=1180 RepID=UPI002FF7F8AB